MYDNMLFNFLVEAGGNGAEISVASLITFCEQSGVFRVLQNAELIDSMAPNLACIGQFSDLIKDTLSKIPERNTIHTVKVLEALFATEGIGFDITQYEAHDLIADGAINELLEQFKNERTADMVRAGIDVFLDQLELGVQIDEACENLESLHLSFVWASREAAEAEMEGEDGDTSD